MIRVELKPLSINEAFQGKRFKTRAYQSYEIQNYYKLPKDLEIPDGKLIIKLRFGFSSKSADWDNPVKPFQDILQKKYKFNDKMIYKAEVEKVDVKKGFEFIEFKIESYAEAPN